MTREEKHTEITNFLFCENLTDREDASYCAHKILEITKDDKKYFEIECN